MYKKNLNFQSAKGKKCLVLMMSSGCIAHPVCSEQQPLFSLYLLRCTPGFLVIAALRQRAQRYGCSYLAYLKLVSYMLLTIRELHFASSPEIPTHTMTSVSQSQSYHQWSVQQFLFPSSTSIVIVQFCFLVFGFRFLSRAIDSVWMSGDGGK